MTDTPTPPAMTPEQRAELVTHYTRGKWYIWNGGADCPVPLGTRLEIVGGFDDNWITVAEEGSIFWPNVAAFRIDPPTSKLTAERDAAQAEIARLTAALATPDQIAALAADRAATVTVKPLEWVKDTMPNAAPQRYRAATHDGTGDYSVSGSKNSDAWQWFRNGYFVDGHQHHKPMPLDAAKAAAKADYDARIRSAITIPRGDAEITRLRAVIAKDAAQMIEDQHKMHKAVEALRESVLAIQYLDERAPSGTTPPTLAKITAVLAEIGGA